MPSASALAYQGTRGSRAARASAWVSRRMAWAQSRRRLRYRFRIRLHGVDCASCSICRDQQEGRPLALLGELGLGRELGVGRAPIFDMGDHEAGADECIERGAEGAMLLYDAVDEPTAPPLALDLVA